MLIRNRPIPTVYVLILPSARNPQNKPTNNLELRHLELNRLYRQYNSLAALKEGMLPDEFRTYYEKPDILRPSIQIKRYRFYLNYKD